MSDHTTQQQLLDILNEQCADMKCPSCEQGNWILDPKTFRYFPHALAKPKNETARARPILPLTCEGCGNVAFVAPEVMDKAQEQISFALDDDSEENNNEISFILE